MGAEFLDGYVPVAERIVKWFEMYPEGRIVADPPTVVDVAGNPHLASTARVYRTADDPTPCQGSALEPYPGKTNFTRDSEAQNAETAAVGRALALAGIEVKRGFASREEVRNRQPEPAVEVHPDAATLQLRLNALTIVARGKALKAAAKAAEVEVHAVADACTNEVWVEWWDALLTKAEKATAEPIESYTAEQMEPM